MIGCVVDGFVLRVGRLLFGTGSVEALAEVAPAVGRRLLICTDQSIARTGVLARVTQIVSSSGSAVEIFSDGLPEVPLATVHECTAFARQAGVDGVIGLGGGSSLDLAKLVALGLATDGVPLSEFYGENLVESPIGPVVGIPTTAGTGSEVSPVAVLSDPHHQLKVGISSHYLVPSYAICDPALTTTCPPSVTAHAGIDALAHAIEAFTAASRDRNYHVLTEQVFIGKNPISDGFALGAVEQIAHYLTRAVANGHDPEARNGMLFGSTLAGLAFGHAGTTLAHALQYPIGAATGTPHGLGIGVLLPFAMEYNRSTCEAAFSQLAQSLSADANIAGDSSSLAIDLVEELAQRIGIPGSLAALGIKRSQLRELARQTLGIQRLLRNNPRPVDQAAAEAVLEAAWLGDRERLR